MKIHVTMEEDKAIMAIEGRIDTQTSSDLRKEIDKIFAENKKKIIMKFDKVEYISSTGLRVLFYVQKKINSFGSGAIFEIRNANDSVKEVFDITGFSDFLTVINKK